MDGGAQMNKWMLRLGTAAVSLTLFGISVEADDALSLRIRDYPPQDVFVEGGCFWPPPNYLPSERLACKIHRFMQLLSENRISDLDESLRVGGLSDLGVRGKIIASLKVDLVGYERELKKLKQAENQDFKGGREAWARNLKWQFTLERYKTTISKAWLPKGWGLRGASQEEVGQDIRGYQKSNSAAEKTIEQANQMRRKLIGLTLQIATHLQRAATNSDHIGDVLEQVIQTDYQREKQIERLASPELSPA